MSKNLEKERTKVNNKRKKGVSLIALVITIIVIIILAMIAFFASTGTVEKANYAKFTTNISEVESEIREKALSLKGDEASRGKQLTDGQIYNYVAKGGKTDSDYLNESSTPKYTIIDEASNINLPEMKVNTPTETNVKITYAVTDEGEVFVWPPYGYDNEYYVTGSEKVDKDQAEKPGAGDIDIKIDNNVITIKKDEDGKIKNEDGTSTDEPDVPTKIKLTKPSISGSYTYNGNTQTVTLSVFDSNTMIVTGNTRKDVGSQEVTVSLKDTSKYEWSDGTTSAVVLNWTIAKKSVSVSWSNLNFEYDGANHVPTATLNGVVAGDSVSVNVSGTASTEGEHTATATLTGSSAENYELTNTTTKFTIVKTTVNVSTLTITLSGTSFTYTGAEIKPTVTIKNGATTLSAGTDYTLSYGNNKNAGTATITIKGNGKYVGTTTKNFTIERAKTASATASDKTYNGSAQTGVTGTNVDLSGTTSATSVGTYTATATPKANYAWSDGTTTAKTLTWKITEKASSSLTVTLATTTYTYDGTAKEPAVTVKDGSTTLTSGTHYTVSYSNNTNAGTATATITMKGNYSGTITKNFTIEKAKTASTTASDKTYNGSAQTGVTGTNVDLSGTTSATNVGTYTATATPKANYAWSDGTTTAKTLTWKITEKASSSLTVTLATTTYTYDGTAKEPAVTVKDGSTTLTLNTHYTVAYSNNINAGTATVTITMKGNYSGTITKNFTIERAKTASATVADKTYNGSDQIGVTGTNVDLSGTTSATNVGTYTATATPKANYAWSDGTTTAKILTWKITEKASSSLTVTLATTTYTYDGTAKEPAVTVKDGSTTLTLNTHYTVAYSNNINAGTATVTITMKGNYSGTITKNFTIERAKTASATASDKTYNGSAQIGVTGTNVDLSGTTSATNVGTYTATATPKANYAWSDGTTTAKTLTWKMFKKQVSAEWGSEIVFIYDGKEHAPTVTIPTGVTGETIDVSITGKQINASDTVYTATAVAESVTGGNAKLNNYEVTGTTKEYTISKREVMVVWADIKIEYTGKILSPTATADSKVEGETITLAVTGGETAPGTHTAIASIAEVVGGQAKASNYNLTNTSTEFEITKHLKVGDYVNYVPTSKTITTDTSKTGYDTAQTLTTQANTQWRVFSIDETTGEILLTTQGATNTDTNVYLKGAMGYVHGAEELNRICKELYSSGSLTARSMTMEDLDKAVGYDPTTDSDYGKEYTYTSGTYYTYEENGKTVTSETPKEASSSNPVTVKGTSYYYRPCSKNPTVGNILGGSYGWLASLLVYVNSSQAAFVMHYASTIDVNGNGLCSSDGYVDTLSSGVRPIVSLNSKYLLNLDETGKDGLTADTAWNIIGVDITGEEKTESTLTLDTSKIPSTYKVTSKQWYSSDTQSIEDGTAIENATGDTYKVELSMAKKYIYVVVKATAPNGTEVELKTITQNYIAGLVVGDYVNYIPTSKTITTDTSKTGYNTVETLTTQANTQWRVLSIDKTTGEILLTTQGATNTDTNVTLNRAMGYVHGAEELNRICKELYSSGSLTARSMTIEDINEAVGYDPTTYSDYGKEYTYTSGTFYTYEENGKTVTSETPKVASSSNPVTVKKTYYNYTPSDKNSTVADILGSSYGWLASPCVYANSSSVYFGLRYAGSSNVGGYGLYHSHGDVTTPSIGVRPVISLSSKDMLNLEETRKDGLTADTAWNIIGVDIIGEEKTESILTLDTSKIPSTYKVTSKQWYSSDTQSVEGGTAIENATGDTYKVELSMAKKYIYVVVKATAPNGTEVELKTITQNYIAGLVVGDYVNYIPTSKTITTDTSKTGYNTVETLTTQANTQWRVLSIDKTTGEILLTTQGATNTDTNVTLNRAMGYVHGAEELNRICKELYSSGSLTARSMTIEDINEAVGYDPTTYSDYGKEYTYTSGTFYTYEENGKTVTSETPKVASSSNPVTVKKTYYNYTPSDKNSTVADILGSSYGWLASPCVYANSSSVYFGLRYAGSSNVGGYGLYHSHGDVTTPSIGVRPVISLSSKDMLNLEETRKDGLTADTAWNIIGVDIIGEEKTESILTLDTSKIPSTYKVTSKQWYSSDIQSIEGGTAIENATGDTYKVELSMAKKYIYVVVKATAPNGTEVELRTITQNYIAGLAVGDYVNYVPTSKTITTDTSKTGYNTVETLTTQANTQWRVLSIDKTTGEILLTTQGATNTDTNVTLKGATGYLHGAEELNRICKELYSNTEKGITARSMTIEDLNKAVGYDPTSDDRSDYGKEKTYTSGTFYTYEENGKTVTSETPKVASSSNPVTVKRTYYSYNPGSKNSTVGNILGSSLGWLASPYVLLYSEYASAYFGLRMAWTTNVDGSYSVMSTGNVGTRSWGLRSVVSLSSKLLDIGDESKDGTTVATAWNLR